MDKDKIQAGGVQTAKASRKQSSLSSKEMSLYLGGIGNKQGFKQGPVQSDLRLESTWLWLPPAQQPGGGWSRSRKPWLPVSCELIVVGLGQSELDSSLCFFQPSIPHDVLCIEVK